jgi:hypothetical protein
MQYIQSRTLTLVLAAAAAISTVVALAVGSSTTAQAVKNCADLHNCTGTATCNVEGVEQPLCWFTCSDPHDGVCSFIG